MWNLFYNNINVSGWCRRLCEKRSHGDEGGHTEDEKMTVTKSYLWRRLSLSNDRQVTGYAPQLILPVSPDYWLRCSKVLCCSCICTFRYRNRLVWLGARRCFECTEKGQMERFQHRDSRRNPHFTVGGGEELGRRGCVVGYCWFWSLRLLHYPVINVGL